MKKGCRNKVSGRRRGKGREGEKAGKEGGREKRRACRARQKEHTMLPDSGKEGPREQREKTSGKEGSSDLETP